MKELSNNVSDDSSKETHLRQTLQERPRNARAIAQLACLLAEQAKEHTDKDTKHSLSKEALSLAERAIDTAQQKPFGYAALSIVHSNFDERMKALRQAIEYSEASEAHQIAMIGLMVRLLTEPREEEARRVRGTVGKASAKHPSRRALDSSESSLYHRIEQAVEQASTVALSTEQKEFIGLREYRLGMFFRKMLPSSLWQPRSRLHLEHARAILPEQHANRLLAEFWLATLSPKKQRVTKCPEQYIVGLYSTFASRFDELLVEKLEYQTPTKLRELVDATVKNNVPRWKKAADLGCGTGLSGLAFCDCVQEIIGVDLSPEMIAKARERQCYKHLVVGDVTAILDANANYNLIIACDVFVYLGDLQEVFEKAYESLAMNGIFALSTEVLEEEVDGSYRLHECARFAHKESYVNRLAMETGFRVLATKICPIRKNQGTLVSGCLFVLQPQ